jgi:hypothetical protein
MSLLGYNITDLGLDKTRIVLFRTIMTSDLHEKDYGTVATCH